MYTLSDADKSVGQSAGATLILWLSGGVAAEHSLDVETQHKTQQTACLTVLRETHTARWDSHTLILYTVYRYCLWLRAEKYYIYYITEKHYMVKKGQKLTWTSFINDLSRSFTPISLSPDIWNAKTTKKWESQVSIHFKMPRTVSDIALCIFVWGNYLPVFACCAGSLCFW